MTPILRITDGTTTVDLLRAPWCMSHWTPQISQPKAGGSYSDSPIADGRILKTFHWDNVNETFTLSFHSGNQDAGAAKLQDIRRLLIQAHEYWTESRNVAPVYIEARSAHETNMRYALIVQGMVNEDNDPYGQVFAPRFGLTQRASMVDLPLVIERGPWLANPPGDSVCVQVGGEYALSATTGDFTPTWAWLSELTNDRSEINCIYTADNGDVFVLTKNGTMDGEIIRSVNNGANWATEANHADRQFTHICNTTAAKLVALAWEVSTKSTYIYYSDDSGNTWNVVQTLTAVGKQYEPGNVITLANGNVLAVVKYYSGSASYIYVYKSTDNGATWAYSTAVTAAAGYWPTWMGIIQTTSGRIMLGGLIWCSSDDNGLTWTHRLTPGGWTSSNFVQTTTGRLVVCSESVSPSVYVSDNDGINWTEAFIWPGTGGYWNGLIQLPSADQPLLCIKGMSFAATACSVYRSTDDGNSWSLEEDISANDWGYGLTVLADNETVLALTWDTANDDLDIYQRTIAGYETISTTTGSEPSCAGTTYIANKYLPYNITHIKAYNDIAAAYTDIHPIAAFPQDLFDLFEDENIVYFGVAGDLADIHPPFNNLIFDIQTPINNPGTYSIVWEYSDGAAGWPTLSVADHTNNGGGVFSQTGVECVSWESPYDWAEEAVDGTQAFWVRARIDTLDGGLVYDVPTQQNRQIYTANLPYVTIDEAQVGGDLKALARMLLVNETDYDGPDPFTGVVHAYANRVMVGLRSDARGTDFCGYLAASDVLLPTGISCAVGQGTVFIDTLVSSTGRILQWQPAAATPMQPRISWTINTLVARQYYGKYRAFLRCYQHDGDRGDITVRVRYVGGTGGMYVESLDMPTTVVWNAYGMLDLGLVNLPGSDMLKSTEGVDELTIEVWASAKSGTPDFYIYDFILIPADEWMCDAWDSVGKIETAIEWGKSLDIDSVSYPKVDTRAILRSGQTEANLITGIYAFDSVGPAALLPNTSQRAWFTAMQSFIVYVTDGGTGNAEFLSDATGDFVEKGVQIGDWLINKTDASEGPVTAVESTRVYADLSGGADNDFDNGDQCYIVTRSWLARMNVAHSLKMWRNDRYLSLRGAR